MPRAPRHPVRTFVSTKPTGNSGTLTVRKMRYIFPPSEPHETSVLLKKKKRGGEEGGADTCSQPIMHSALTALNLVTTRLLHDLETFTDIARLNISAGTKTPRDNYSKVS